MTAPHDTQRRGRSSGETERDAKRVIDLMDTLALTAPGERSWESLFKEVREKAGAMLGEVAPVQSEGEREALREALAELVRLKDGPRDALYRAEKDAAWDAARAALAAHHTGGRD